MRCAAFGTGWRSEVWRRFVRTRIGGTDHTCHTSRYFDGTLMRSGMSLRPSPIEVPSNSPSTRSRRGRAFLVPAAPASLVLRQQTVAESVAATGARMHHHYQVGRWLPHCSMAPRTRLEQLSTVAALAYDVLPLAVRVTGAALIDNSTGESWVLTNLP